MSTSSSSSDGSEEPALPANGKLPGSSNIKPSSETPGRRRLPPAPHQPHYLTVGGSTSASAAALMASLDHDSGYGSMNGENSDASTGWQAFHDLPTPIHTPGLVQGTAEAENDKRGLASHIHQLYFNQNRVALGRSISRTIETLRGLQEMNAQWPAHYPSIPKPQELLSRSLRPGMSHSRSTGPNRLDLERFELESELESSLGSNLEISLDSDFEPDSHSNLESYLEPHLEASLPSEAGSKLRPDRPNHLRRAATTALDPLEESSRSRAGASSRAAQLPALITPHAVQEFSILKLDLKMQGWTQSQIAHSMDRKMIASLLDGQINQSVRHLQLLRDRIEDTSSKVLVTGDLNAGKSTFCNALLRRKILPEDQQPCTSIFCEVLDARENGGLEEVHAVHKDVTYNRNNESTFDVYTLEDLARIVTDSSKYTQCKVYVKDVRTIDQSLLNNGVVDISIIDAPGLNSDSIKTTAVYARQEEIDVVVFVVSAANHFTLSARDFIWNAAQEKAYIFIVVNGFDNIRDKERCQRGVLEQVAKLSPRTFKESSELVHFVSSNAIPTVPLGAGPQGGHDDGGGGPDDPTEPDQGKGKEREKLQDFEDLETALRRFVLEKRARSKLAPAKTYLLNVLTDLHVLASTNLDVAEAELDRMARELRELEPVFEASKQARSQVSDDIEKTIETTCSSIYAHTRETLGRTLATAGCDLDVPYPGLLHVFQYAEDLKSAILDQIAVAVSSREDHAREKAVDGVNAIKSLAMLHLGDEHEDLSFRSDLMFRKKRDVLARQIDTRLELFDLVDLTGLWERQEKMAGTGMAMTVATVLGGRLVGGVGWLDGALGAVRIVGVGSLRKMIIPGLIATVVLGTAYLIHSIPTALPSRLSQRIAATLSILDYSHTNSVRISSEVGKVLRYPADHLRVGLQHSVAKLTAQREEKVKTQKESEIARKYFGNLLRESSEGKQRVEAVDLEGGAPGIAGSYESGVMV